ncbi:MAG TPA: hypothetical protein PLP57_03175 [Candidatus Saccharicenans sp.]|jgi:hypothetical protein|nr:hypothetical protein [Candidatus Saccharicenans sp.]HRD01632.1 hypothetical protein [Candidatus Saccharicenans sp.]
MEEIEISSWATLDALKKAADVVETVGDFHSDQEMYVFCVLDEDYLELGYSTAGPNYLRHYADEDEFTEAIEKRREGLDDSLLDDGDYDDFEDEGLDFDDESDDL